MQGCLRAIVCRRAVAFGAVSKDLYPSIFNKPLVQVIFWLFTDSSNMSMYTTCAERSHVYEWKWPFKWMEKLNGTGTNIKWMLNESKTEMGCPLNGM